VVDVRDLYSGMIRAVGQSIILYFSVELIDSADLGNLVNASWVDYMQAGHSEHADRLEDYSPVTMSLPLLTVLPAEYCTR